MGKNLKPSVREKIPFVCHAGGRIKHSVGQNIPYVGFSKIFGVTLIELLTVLAVVGILAGIAAPALTQFVQSNRLTTATNDLVLDLAVARSEALKYHSQAIVCESTSGTDCTTTGSWDSGWIVFVDLDNSDAWSAGDNLLKVHPALPDNNSSTPSANKIIFTRQGSIDSGWGDFELCNSSIHKKRTIAISAVGRVTIAEGGC